MLSSTAMSKQSDGVSSATGSQQCYNVQFYKQYHISSIFLLKGSSRACVYPGSKHGCEEALCPGRFLFLHQTEHFLPTIWNPHIFPHFSHTNLNISLHISSPIPPISFTSISHFLPKMLFHRSLLHLDGRTVSRLHRYLPINSLPACRSFSWLSV